MSSSREKEALLNEIGLREASLRDARRELESEDMSPAQFEAIERRERGALDTADGATRRRTDGDAMPDQSHVIGFCGLPHVSRSVGGEPGDRRHVCVDCGYR